MTTAARPVSASRDVFAAARTDRGDHRDHREHRRSSTRVLVVLCFAQFMAALDLMVVNVAFPSIEKSFAGSSLSQLSWVLNGYIVVYAALLVPAGRLADRYGRRTGLLLGLGIFTAASVACAGE